MLKLLDTFGVPTDTLYKFKAIGGIILLVLPTALLMDYSLKKKDQIHQVGIEQIQLRSEFEVLQTLSSQTQDKLQSLSHLIYMKDLKAAHEILAAKIHELQSSLVLFAGFIVLWLLACALGSRLTTEGFKEWAAAEHQSLPAEAFSENCDESDVKDIAPIKTT